MNDIEVIQACLKDANDCLDVLKQSNHDHQAWLDTLMQLLDMAKRRAENIVEEEKKKAIIESDEAKYYWTGEDL